MDIFTLTGKILVDSRDAENSIDKTGKEAESMGKKLGDGIKTAAKWGTFIGASALAVGLKVSQMGKEMSSALDVVDKGSQRMKISAENYQELAHAADLSGVSMSTLEKAAKKLEGTDISFDDAMEQIYALGTANERAAKAAELFGETVAYQMTPMLNASGEEMAAMRQEAHELGKVYGEDMVAQGAALNDMFAKIEGSTNALKTSIMSQFMPYVMEIMDWVIENMPRIQETVQKVMDAIWPIVQTVLDLIMKALPPLMDAIVSFMDWILPYIEPIINAIGGFIDGFVALMSGDVGTFLTSVKDLLLAELQPLFDIGEKLFTWLWDGIKSVWDSISSWVTEKVEWLENKLYFWRKGAAEMSGDPTIKGTNFRGRGGSFAAGLPYVPYDGYQAELHKGETVLNAQNTANLINSLRESIASQSQDSGPIELVINLDGQQFASATYDARQRESQRRGGRLVNA